VTDEQRQRFDGLLEDVIAGLPVRIAELIHEVPVLVLDRPSPEMIGTLRREGTIGPDEDGSDLCGLHSGVGMTQRSLEDPGGWGGGGADAGVPEHIHLFREGIIALAFESLGGGGGWEDSEADEEIYEEVRITLLHELGHHFGLDEQDLDDLGYA